MFSLTLIVFLNMYLIAQNPMDERLYDKVKSEIGEDAKELYACGGSKQNERLFGGVCSITLNKGLRYRFTCGNSDKSSGAVTIMLSFKEAEKMEEKKIESIKVDRAEVDNFEFLCDKTGRYSLSSSFDKEGYGYEVTIISQVLE